MDSEELALKLYDEESERRERLGEAMQVAYDAMLVTLADTLAKELTEEEATQAGVTDTADDLFRNWFTKGWA